MVGKVVVVFYWSQGDGVAEETEVVDGDGLGEDCLDCCFCFEKESLVNSS